MPPSSPRWSANHANVAISLFLVAGIILLYGHCLGNGFVYDDEQYITLNPHAQAGINGNDLTWAFTSFYASNWHPLTWISLQLDNQWFGMKPSGYHLHNVILHAANSLLLFWILWGMTQARWRSALVAALFAIHPAHVESVAWVAERKDVLSTFFGFLTLIAYFFYVKRPSLAHYATVVLAFALSLLAKPMLVTLPALLLLLDWWPLRRFQGPWFHLPMSPAGNRKGEITKSRTTGWLLLEKTPLVGLAIASSIMTILAQGAGGALAATEQVSFPIRLGNAVIAYGSYLGKMVWPRYLTVFYPHPRFSLPLGPLLVSAVALLGCSIMAYRWRRRFPYLMVGWLWYIGTLVPVIGLIQVGAQALADRYTYFPLIGIFIALSWGLGDLIISNRLSLRWSAVGASLVLGACFLASWIQIGYWHDPVALWSHALAATDQNAKAHYNLGVALEQQGRLEEAAREYREASRINPDMDIAYNNLGQVYARRKNFNDARQYFEKALKIRPDFSIARFNLGLAWLDLGNSERARREFEETLRTDSGYAPAHTELARLLTRAGKAREALDHLRAVVQLEPANPEAHLNLGQFLVLQGQTEEAIAELSESARLKPDLVLAQYYLGTAWVRLGNPLAAIPFYQEAIRLSPQFPNGYEDLGIALVLAGNPASALRYFEEAARLQPRNGKFRLGIAHCHFQLGETALAQEEYSQASRQQPDWLDAANTAAWKMATDPDERQRFGLMAIYLARQACEATGNARSEYLDTVAAAYAESGRFDDAVVAGRQSLTLTPIADAKSREERARRLGVYQSHQPLRNPASNPP